MVYKEQQQSSSSYQEPKPYSFICLVCVTIVCGFFLTLRPLNVSELNDLGSTDDGREKQQLRVDPRVKDEPRKRERREGALIGSFR